MLLSLADILPRVPDCKVSLQSIVDEYKLQVLHGPGRPVQRAPLSGVEGEADGVVAVDVLRRALRMGAEQAVRSVRGEEEDGSNGR